MLKIFTENKMIEPAALAAGADQEEYEQNLVLIATVFLKQFLGIHLYTPDGRGVVRMHGGGVFATHRGAYVRQLREKLSFTQASEQAAAIVNARGAAVEAMPFCPVPKYLPEYSAQLEDARRREQAKPKGLGKIGEIVSGVYK